MRLGRLSGITFVFLLCSVAASATDFSFTGTFSQDDQLEIFQFTAPSSSVLLRTWSYAGGTNAAGTLIAPGGFDPVLSLFDATAGLVASSPLEATNDDGAGVAVDPATGNAFDSLLQINTLLVGNTYVLVLSQSGNFAFGPTFGDGFSQQGTGNFTPGMFGCGGTSFCDVSAAQRTGAWAVDIAGVGAASDLTVPEPGSMTLLTTAIACLLLLRRKKRTVI
jgi:hypothetical protein